MVMMGMTCVCGVVMRDEFREEPADVELAAGHTATLRCRPPRAEPDPRVAWKKDGVELAPDGDRIYVDRFGSLHVMDARRDDTGQYACVAENIAGQRQSAPAQLTVRGDYLHYPSSFLSPLCCLVKRFGRDSI